MSKYFSDGALTAESRRTLVESCIDLFIEGNLPGAAPGAGAGVFDGIDLDWEWPGSEGNPGNIIRPEDKRNFTKLVAEFRAQLDDAGETAGKHYELTAFLPAAPAKIDAGFEVRKVFALLDFATVQGYDFHGTWETTTNHQAQLYSPSGDPDPAGFSLDLAIDSYRARGAPAGKLVVGVPYFGRGWTGVPSANNGLYQTSTGAGTGHVRGRGRGLQGARGQTGPALPRPRQRCPLALRRHRSGGATTTRSPSPGRCCTCASIDSAGRWCGRSTPTTRGAR